jgi:hypothetical protein
MNQSKIFNRILHKMNLLLDNKILPQHDIDEINENIELIEEDNQKFKKNITTAKKLITDIFDNNREIVAGATADINLFLVDVRSELKSIKSVLNNANKTNKKN